MKFKISQFGKRGGGQHFSKMSEIQKCPKGRRGGGGVNPNCDIVPNFLDFLFWGKIGTPFLFYPALFCIVSQ